jgi:hypothetical protein
MEDITGKNQTRPLQPTEREALFSHFVSVADPKTTSVFCVDGRKGKRANANGEDSTEPYLQALGGSYHIAALEWLLNGKRGEDFSLSANATLSKMKEEGMRISLHTGPHNQGDSSDCGFADNLQEIITTLQVRGSDIWNLISHTDPSFRELQGNWDSLIESIQQANLESIPSGRNLINKAKKQYNSDFQILEGEHGERAAVVNLKPNTTLDVDKNQDTPAFNLDLWHVLEQAAKLGIDKNKATLLSLGLYVATEIVLVENKGKQRLPIIVNK